jgi:hypothetical protein
MHVALHVGMIYYTKSCTTNKTTKTCKEKKNTKKLFDVPKRYEQ